MRRLLPLFAVALFLALPVLLPESLEFQVTLLNYIGLYALAALGLVLLTGIGGLTSFGQAAFVGVGAYTTAWLTTAFGWNPWLTLVIALVATTAVALCLGFITLRMGGHYLPLGTIAWGMSLYFLFGNIEAFGGHTGLSGIPPLTIGGVALKSGREFFYPIWIALLLAVVATHNLLDSRAGRAIRALKGGVVMAEAMGVNTARYKIIIFTIAAQFACVSGWLYAHLQRFINPTPFSLVQGIEYLFMAVLGGVGHIGGALLGAGLVTVLKQWLQDALPALLGQSGNFEMIVFGLVMIVVLHRARDGLWPVLRRLRPRRPIVPTLGVEAAEPLARRSPPAAGDVLLDVRGVSKRFGGLVANDAISFSVRAGEVLALIGPNGAGKSTLFNCISGVNPPSAGEVLFCGESVAGLASREIAARGMSRSFQHVRLLADMSVLDNVAVGAHLRGGRHFAHAALRLDREEERRLRAEAARQIERVGLAEHLFDAAGSLPLGKQRIVEIARALAADPCLLLLDEPAAGLRYLEKQSLAALLRQLREEGMGILLVEHDMDFVMGLADRVVVMEFGEKLVEGLPDDICRDPRVLEAYLGGVDE